MADYAANKPISGRKAVAGDKGHVVRIAEQDRQVLMMYDESSFLNQQMFFLAWTHNFIVLPALSKLYIGLSNYTITAMCQMAHSKLTIEDQTF